MGQYVGIQPLQDHCCSVLSTLLEVYKADSTSEAINVLGEQLQVAGFIDFIDYIDYLYP